MTIHFLSDTIWRRITKLARSAGSARVAVAYFGQGGSKLLPLKSGGVLVVDLSKAAVRSGQTCPQEVARLLRKGVEVHSCSNLHGKVFVFGRRAVVGSRNASRNSEQALIEAAVETTDPEVVQSCRSFVDSLRGEHVDLDYARRLAKIYKPPKFAGNAASQTPRHSPLWAVPLVLQDWEAKDNEVFERNKPAAEKKLKDQKRFRLDSYIWTGGGFRPPLQIGELILQVIKESPGRVMLTPVSRVILIRRYKTPKEERMMVFLRTPKVRRKKLADVKDCLVETGKVLRRLKNPRLIKARQAVHDILQLWSSLDDFE
jgi:hypothetical protein